MHGSGEACIRPPTYASAAARGVQRESDKVCHDDHTGDLESKDDAVADQDNRPDTLTYRPDRLSASTNFDALG